MKSTTTPIFLIGIVCLFWGLTGKSSPVTPISTENNFSFLSHRYPQKVNQALKSNGLKTKPNPEVIEDNNSFNKSQILFIENKGQIIDVEGNRRPDLLFKTNSNGAQVYISSNKIYYVFNRVEMEESKNRSFAENDKIKTSKVTQFRMSVSLEGANLNPQVIKEKANSYYENYYLGHCKEGITAHSYEKVILKNIYNGVDWVIYSNGSGIKYDFVLSEARLASKIKLKIEGAQLSIGSNGQLELNTPLGSIKEAKPISFQNGKEIQTSFVLNDNLVSYKTAQTEPSQPLVIDPEVNWSTYYGGSGEDDCLAVTSDGLGGIYNGGLTSSINFPVLNGAFTYSGSSDGFLFKMSTTGTRLWSSFFGGAYDDRFTSIAYKNGVIVAAGESSSGNLPVTSSAFQQNLGSFDSDGMITKFSPTGNLTFCSYIGGNSTDYIEGIDYDNSGNIFITGRTNSFNFINRGGNWGSFTGTNFDVFIAKISSSNQVDWSRPLAGSSFDYGHSITLDAAGSVYIAGQTASPNFPITQPFQAGNTFEDGFVTKLSNNGSIVWSRYIRGNVFEDITSIKIGKNNEIYITGITNSSNLPMVNGFQNNVQGIFDAFLLRFNQQGNVTWGTYYGGSSDDDGNTIDIDDSGNVYLVGITNSTNFPVLNPYQSNKSQLWDAFSVKFGPNGNRIWATYIGGNGDDAGNSCVFDSVAGLVMAGYTKSSNFPLVNNSIGTSVTTIKSGISVAFIECQSIPKPVITASGPLVLCNGSSIVLTAPSGYNYLWSNGSTNQSVTVDSAISLFVSVSIGACQSKFSDTINVRHFTPSAPTITALGSTSICPGDSVILSGPAGNGINYIWSNNATSRSIKVSNTGAYTLRTASSNCTSAVSDPIIISAKPPLPAPVISPSGPTTFCSGDSVILSAPFGFRYLWSNGDTNQAITVNNQATYSVRIIDGRCTSAISQPTSTIVTPIPNSPSLSANGPTSFCLGDSVILTATISSGYLWSNGATTRSVVIKSGGDYSVQSVNGTCISAPSNSVSIMVSPPERPSIIASGSTTICDGDSVTLSAPPGFLYLWNDNSVSETRVVKLNGSYTIKTIANGCTSTVSDPVNIVVNPKPLPLIISAGGPTGFCIGDSVTLTASSSPGYLWSNGETTQSIKAKRGGNYYVKSVSLGCSSDTSNNIQVSVSPPENPIISTSGPTEICIGDSVLLSAPDGLQYLWSNNEISQTISVKIGGLFTVRTILNNCTSAISPPVQVVVSPYPLKPSITPQSALDFCAGRSVTLSAPSASGYLWSTGEMTQTIVVTEAGNYKVQTLNGTCISPVSDSVTVVVRDTASTILGAQVCQGTVIPFGTTQISTSGVYRRVLTNAAGCDSTIIFDALIIPLPSTAFRTGANGARALGSGPRFSYQWLSSSGIVVSNTDTLTAVQGGTFRLVVTDSIFGVGCSDTSSIFTITSIGNYNYKSEIGLYPNPASNAVKITGISSEAQITLVNAIGQRIGKAINNEGRLDLADLSSGYYTVEVLADKKVQRLQLLLQR